MARNIRKASADDLFKSILDTIDNFVARNEPQLMELYQRWAGHSVDAGEMQALPDEFGDFVYHSMMDGPEGQAAIKRFVQGHLNDLKLSDLMDQFVAQKRPVPGITPPPVIAAELRQIADKLDASKRPNRQLVAAEIRRVISSLR